MSNTCPWQVGKLYKTKGSLIAKIVEIKERSVPKELSIRELEVLLSKPHYGIVGYVYAISNLTKGYRVEWTLNGIHSLDPETSNVADLTTEEFINESNR